MISLYTLNGVDSDKPTRVLRYKLIWCQQGSASIVIDAQQFSLTENELVSITSGQVHYFKEIIGCIRVLEFTLDFICKDENDIELIFHNGLFCHFGMNEVICIYETEKFEGLLNAIDIELSTQPYQYRIALRTYIELLIVEVNRAKIARGDEIWKPSALFLYFLELVRNNFSRNYSLVDIAAILNTTETKLNELAKLHTSKTAQNVIYSLVVSEAKRLLIYQSHRSIKEIAFELGFSDPFYFSNFFKKHTTLSPKDYRKAYLL